MAKSRNKTNQSTGIFLIKIIIIIILVSLSINNYKLINNEEKINKSIYSKLSNTEKEYEEALTNNNNLKEEITIFNDIDHTITTIKESVFDKAKQLEDKINQNKTSYKIAYLTFDDGPYHTTDEVLNILKKYKIKATFFTIGLDKDVCYDNKNYSCKETYKKIVDNGHTIANHTYSHAIFRGLYTNADTFMSAVKTQEELIQNRTGIKTNIIRFPGGINTARYLCKNDIDTILKRLKDNHYGWVDWTASDGDGGYLPTTELAWNNFTKTINENIEVVLFHDYSNATIGILPDAINYLEERNYILLPLFYESTKVNK